MSTPGRDPRSLTTRCIPVGVLPVGGRWPAGRSSRLPRTSRSLRSYRPGTRHPLRYAVTEWRRGAPRRAPRRQADPRRADPHSAPTCRPGRPPPTRSSSTSTSKAGPGAPCVGSASRSPRPSAPSPGRCRSSATGSSSLWARTSATVETTYPACPRLRRSARLLEWRELSQSCRSGHHNLGLGRRCEVTHPACAHLHSSARLLDYRHADRTGHHNLGWRVGGSACRARSRRLIKRL